MQLHGQSFGAQAQREQQNNGSQREQVASPQSCVNSIVGGVEVRKLLLRPGCFGNREQSGDFDSCQNRPWNVARRGQLAQPDREKTQ